MGSRLDLPVAEKATLVGIKTIRLPIFPSFSSTAKFDHFFIALPVLIQIYGLDYRDILYIVTIIGAYQLTILTVKKVFNKKLWKWMLTAIIFMAFILMIEIIPPSVNAFIAVVLLVTLVLLHRNLAKNNRWLLNEMRIEQSERSKYSHLILKHSVEVEKKSHNYNKKPGLLFRNSNRIFKKRNRENGLLEFQLKSFLRDRNYMLSYAQLVGLTCFALIIVPFWVKIIIYGSFIFFIQYWGGMISRKMLTDPFFQVVPLKDTKLDVVEAGFKKRISYAPIILTSVIILYFYFMN
ncbi:ABC transporter permease [Halobacillus locisalis]|uniref:ABC transporter permease n=1 Tax=Halobacillus locisalis TaxID=220753 RepID=A0A838CWA6_9BACI|nr:ABC transporter permease [Halobacillus locisalis]MBA2176218.1 ABC transporter permease [Halobacillus locisalis]